MLALQDFGKAAHRFPHRHIFAGLVGESFGYEERLRQETLNLAGAEDRQLVFFRQLFDAQNGDDVLQLFVALQHLLHPPRQPVMLFADDARLQDAGIGRQRVHRRVKPLGGQRPLQRHHSVQVAESGYDAGVGVVVGRDIDGLERGDGAAAGGGDAFLQGAHFGAEGGLVADGGGHPPQQRRHLHTGQDVAVDVVDEQQHILVLLFAEILAHRQAGEGDAGADAGRFVHLAEHQHGAGKHAGVLHFVPQVVALAGALAHAGEHRHALMHRADVADEFLDDDGLADAGAAVGPDFAAFHKGGNQVENLDAGFQNLHRLALVVERGRVAVDGPAQRGFHRPQVVQRGAGDVEQAAQGFGADGDGYAGAGVGDFHAPGQAVGGAQGQAAHPVVADVLLHFQHQPLAVVVHLHRIEQPGQFVGGEFHIHHRADNLNNLASRHHPLLKTGG